MKFKYVISFCIICTLLNEGVRAENKPRIIVLSDISGLQEPDDTQSFIRFLLYSNEFEVEGIVGTGSKYGPTRGDIAYFKKIIDAFGQVRNNLLLHADGYPTAAHLTSVLRHGQRSTVGMEGVGNGKNTEGSDLIIEALRKDDPRPLWLSIWGATGTLAQALWDIKHNMGLKDAEIDRLISKIRVYDIAGQDDAGGWIAKNFPDIFYIRSSVQFLGFTQGHVAASQGGDLSVANDEWFNENIMGYGPLGALYPKRKWMYEGDTPSFLYLLSNGLSDPECVYCGGWGGRFRKDKVKNANEFSHTKVDESAYYDFFIYNDAYDNWNYQGIEYNDVYCPLFRWREDYQNDFLARLHWTMLPFNKANHNPVAIVNNDKSKNFIIKQIAVGEQVALDASGSYDPDGDNLSFEWFYYPEAGTYKGEIQIKDADSPNALVRVPDDASGTEMHIILRVKDYGTPGLFAYRRIIIQAKDK
ncbi:MAG: DUF1593 domain-containing protein [Cyclobacteriaceae bacterium]|nr:DUF1593 domain-containing protein [Cyclobacteriaceae bacterium]